MTSDNEILVYDHEETCPYLPGLTARMPLRMPTATLTGKQFDARLAAGDRRSGKYLYRTQCPTCRACEPIRLDVHTFEPSRTQKRTLRRGDSVLKTIVQAPIVDRQRVDLFNAHKRARGLNQRERESDLYDYEMFLADSCCDTIELSYYLDDQLVGVAIADRGELSLSAVYCHFDVRHARLSIGSYSVLKHVQLALQWRMRYVYLGLYIAASPHMSYKATYLPHERLVDDEWCVFQRPSG